MSKMRLPIEVREMFRFFGAKGGHATKGNRSPARRAAAILANKARWSGHTLCPCKMCVYQRASRARKKVSEKG